MNNSLYVSKIKRILDVIFSITLVLSLSWLFIILIILVFISSHGKVFLSQTRFGKNKKHFQCYKFITMSDDDKLLPLGKLLRKTSLDELPQLINTIKGDMSFVGPRPVILKEEEVVILREEVSANNVYPGLTGLAQIHGRDLIDSETKAKLDGEYIKRISFREDLKIILITIIYIFKFDKVK